MALVFLCGQKACGKTFYLNKLIKEQNCIGYDLDAEILRNSNFENIRELYNKIGEDSFRKLEDSTFDSLIAVCPENAVIALGGGALQLVEKCNNLGHTVYLYREPDILFERMQKVGLPPFIKNREEFDTLFAKRNKYYSENCNLIIDLSETGEKQLCQIFSEMYLR